MRSFFYAKLAWNNLRRNSKTQIPFLLTCIGIVLMFYNVFALAKNPSVASNGSLQAMMYLGTIVTAIFSCIFLFYTNSFLIKRRKKEFGLFFVLGMEKKHIGKMMFWESLMTGVFSIGVGLLLGMAFSKLVTLLLYKILRFDPNLPFSISGVSLAGSLILFGGLFFLMFLFNLRQVYSAQPTELLMGGNVGEKEPKAKWLLVVIGVLTLGTGYYLAITIQDPLAVIGVFFLAVILVMIGTYCLFTAGSIALLKTLKRNKGYYYQAKHFIPVSGMIYRMKQNAVGLANICLMSTAVLVMVSTTVSMYAGVESLLESRYPRDLTVDIQHTPEAAVDLEAFSQKINGIFLDGNVPIENYSDYNRLSFSVKQQGNSYGAIDTGDTAASNNVSVIFLVSAQDYARNCGVPVTLNPGEALVCSSRKMESLQIFDREYAVKEQLTQSPDELNTLAWNVDELFVVLPEDEDLYAAYEAQAEAYGKNASTFHYQIAFDFDLPEAERETVFQNFLLEELRGEDFEEYDMNANSKQQNRAAFYELYGGLFFLGIFLGSLFLMATVLIIYYKQVVEGFEDKERFEIMQKVGMSRAEVKKSIRSQVLTVFALPILAAGVHLCFAFPILTKLLALLSLTDVQLFAFVMIASVLVFCVIYAVVYFLTARVYYKIVEG